MPRDDTLTALRSANPRISWASALDAAAFAPYGRVVHGYDFGELLAYYRQNTPMPAAGNRYIADDPAAHMPVVAELSRALFGGMPLQSGHCCGHNSMLDALEYHKGSEVDIAASDCALLLATLFDMAGGRLDSARVRAFYLPRGTAVELFATTLHYSPCRVRREGFRVGVVLPLGTNTPLDYADGREPALYMRNKWLLAHKDCKRLTDGGAYPGITGENYQIIPIEHA